VDPAEPLAVKSPVEVIEPQLEVHNTGTFAVNCCVRPCGVVAEFGVIVIGEVTVAVVEAFAPLLADAVTTHAPGTRGAVYRPPDVILPQVAEKLAVALAENCWLAPSSIDGLCGEMESTVVVGGPILSYPNTVNLGLVVAMPSMVQ
jgi:hypothetical protein